MTAEPNLSSVAGHDFPAVGATAFSVLDIPVEPGLLALRVQRAPARHDLFDGAWWPRSRDVHAELPGLVSVLHEHLGDVASIGLDADSWDGLGRPVHVEGRLLQIDWLPVGDDTVIVTRNDTETFMLQILSPDEGLDQAQAAMSMATHIGNTETGEQTDISAPQPQRAAQAQGMRWT
jgi:hypothetical protein